uniref:Uncharacterized protein n=1 Tax=Anguilla anguilla TaxID=7936 RepID=A0A0E9WC00_ANGAN
MFYFNICSWRGGTATTLWAGFCAPYQLWGRYSLFSLKYAHLLVRLVFSAINKYSSCFVKVIYFVSPAFVTSDRFSSDIQPFLS